MPVFRVACMLALGVLGGCTSKQVVTTPAPEPVAGAAVRYATWLDTAHFITARLVSLDADHLVVERLSRGGSRWAADSVPIVSLSHLQVRTARRNNAAAGVLIGAGAGLALGAVCASQSDDSWFAPSSSECLTLMPLSGAMWGLIVGAVTHRETWAPVTLPRAPTGDPDAPAITVVPADR